MILPGKIFASDSRIMPKFMHFTPDLHIFCAEAGV
jgi:hypothetical protein